MKILLAFSIMVLPGAFLFPAFSDAAEPIIPCGGEGQPACGLCHGFQLLQNIIIFVLFPSLPLNGGFAIVPIIGALLLALGGFFIFASAGNMARLEQGKKIITAVIVGLLIIYGSWVFVNLLLTSTGVASWTGLLTWEITC